MKKLSLLSLFMVLIFALVSCGGPSYDELTLVSAKVKAAPVIDGQGNDAVWAEATEVKAALGATPYRPDNGYDGIRSTDVTMKSVYSGDKAYFLVQWADPTMSFERFPWEKQDDGTWKQLMAKDQTGHENTYYEDKFAFFWNISAEKFATQGCAYSCHMNADDISAGRKYTGGPDEFIDMWHWKSVRLNALNQIDDQYMDDNTDPSENKGWGRKGDTKTGGGYYNNVNDDKSGPKFMDADNGKVVNEQYWILDDNKVPFVDTFDAGDRVAGIVSAPFTGPRGDIKAHGNWKNGVWTLEIERKLVTTGENSETQDVQFKDMKGTYHFGIAAFDNSQINHVYNNEIYKLVFGK